MGFVGDDADDNRFCGFKIPTECQLMHRIEGTQVDDADETANENKKVEDVEPVEQVTAQPKDLCCACLEMLAS